MVLKSFCPKLASAFRNDQIPIIWVESPCLSASFYREYLGFKVLLKKSRANGDEILLNRKGNLIWLKSFRNSGLNEKEINDQAITINTKEIVEDYRKVKEVVRVIRSVNPKSMDSFSVFDCNGIEIVFVSSLKN